MEFQVLFNNGTTFSLDAKVVLLLLVLQLVVPLVVFHLIGSLRSTGAILAHADKIGREVIAIRPARGWARRRHKVSAVQFLYEILLRGEDGRYSTLLMVYGDEVWGGFFDRARFIEPEEEVSLNPDEWDDYQLSRPPTHPVKPRSHDDWSA